MEEASAAEGCEGGVPSSLDYRSPSDLVAKALQALADISAPRDGMDTQAVIVVLEVHRTEVRTKDQAGYFIHVWRELRDHVRKMIAQGSKHRAIKVKRAKP